MTRGHFRRVGSRIADAVLLIAVAALAEKVPQKCHVIVSRYKESIAWVREIASKGVQVTVVNRGKLPWRDKLLSEELNAKSTPTHGQMTTWRAHDTNHLAENVTVVTKFANVGREGFVYLEHMLENLHNGNETEAETNFYCQANPSSPHGYNKKKFVDDVVRLCSPSAGFAQGSRFSPVNKIHGTIAEALERTGFAYMCAKALKSGDRMGNTKDDARRKIEAEFEIVFGEPAKGLKQVRYCPTGCIAVRRDALRRAYEREPRAFEVLLARLGIENAPLGGYMLERAWQRLILGPGSNRAIPTDAINAEPVVAVTPTTTAPARGRSEGLRGDAN